MKDVIYMSRKELMDSVDLLRAWIIDLQRITPHKTIKASCKAILEDT